nr:metalloprotease PmbA [Lysobacter silvestris]
MTQANSADDSPQRIEALSALAQRVLDLCKAGGASQAEVDCSESRGLGTSVRMGAVETVESTRDRGVSLTVYFGQRKGSASTGDFSDASLAATVEHACTIARYTENDPAAGLADPQRMARELREFDQWHPQVFDADAMIAQALACEQAGRDADVRIRNSDGCSSSASESVSVYANSYGFSGHERETQYSLSCALIAGQGDGMQRDGWYTAALRADALEAAQAVGHRAAQLTVERLDPRGLPTGSLPVVFTAEVARSIIGHFIGAVSGGALYRQASFLLDHAGKQVFPDWVSMIEQPHLMGGFRSTSFDAEGTATQVSPLVTNGVLQRYVLGSYSARKLGLQSTANAGGIYNLDVAGNVDGLDAILANLPRALLVTELMGQGVNTVTGDYSRGAAGYLIEHGQRVHPVDGVTIAGNLRDMFSGIEAIGRDIDPRSSTRMGSLLIGRMTVAGG